MARYSDLNPRYGLDSNQLVVADHAAVQQSLSSIFKYTPKSRFMRPNYGSYFWPLLYRNIDTETAFDILQSMQLMIAEREPRIAVDIARTTIVADRENKRYLITLGYTLVEDGTDGVFTTALQGAG